MSCWAFVEADENVSLEAAHLFFFLALSLNPEPPLWGEGSGLFKALITGLSVRPFVHKSVDSGFSMFFQKNVDPDEYQSNRPILVQDFIELHNVHAVEEKHHSDDDENYSCPISFHSFSAMVEFIWSLRGVPTRRADEAPFIGVLWDCFAPLLMTEPFTQKQ